MFLATSVVAGTLGGNRVWSLEIKTSHYFFFLLSLINVFSNLNSCFAETLNLKILLFIKTKIFTDIMWITICTFMKIKIKNIYKTPAQT